MLKFHEYLAKRDGISLEEAARRSLARSWELAQTGKVMALITAFVEGLSYEQNVGRNMELMDNIRDAKFGYTPLYGYWTYERTDTATEEKTKRQVREDSLLVSAPVSIPKDQLRSVVLAWVQKYQQLAAVVKYGDSDIAFELAANGVEKALGKWSINRLADVYSQMRWGADAANRMFVFEAADDYSWSTRLATSSME